MVSETRRERGVNQANGGKGACHREGTRTGSSRADSLPDLISRPSSLRTDRVPLRVLRAALCHCPPGRLSSVAHGLTSRSPPSGHSTAPRRALPSLAPSAARVVFYLSTYTVNSVKAEVRVSFVPCESLSRVLVTCRSGGGH